MPRLPDLTARLRLDARDLDRARGQVNAFTRGTGSALGTLDRSLTQVERSMGKVGEGLTEFGKRASIGASLPIAAGFALATKAASDLEEQTNKTRVVFGDAAQEVLEFSDDSARGLGLSRRAALEAAGTYGNLFAAIGIGNKQSAEMSQTLLRLSADLASFNNANPEDVFLSLRAGLVGETEPLRKFGVNLTDARLRAEALNLGLSDGKSVLDANAKAQAAYSVILRDTAVAQGDFERTSGGLANQTRILRAEFEDVSAEMGANLIPIALKVTSVASDMLGVFGEMPNAAQNVSLIGLAFIAAIGPAAFLAGNVRKLKAGLDAATAAAATQSLATGAAVATGVKLAGVLTKVSLVGAGLFAVAQGIKAIGGNAKGAAEDVGELVKLTTDELVEGFKEAQSFGIGDEVFGEILEKSISEAQRLVDALNAAGVATGDYQQRIDAAVASDAKSVVAKQKDVEATEKAAAALRTNTVATDADTSATESNTDALGPNSAARKESAEAAKAYEAALSDILDATEAAVNAEIDQAQASASFADAIADVSEKERELTEARRERTSAARDAISEERALNAVEDARTSIVDAERDLAEAREGRGDKAKELADAERDLSRVRQDVGAARGLSDLAEAQERAAEAEDRLRQAREEGGQATDVADATEALSRANLNARDAELALTEQREERAERERQSAAAVKSAEDSLAAARLNAQTAALQSASAARELAAAQAESEGRPLTAAAQYRIYRDELIRLKDALAPGGELRTNLDELVNRFPSPEVKFGIVANTVQPNEALESLRQGYQRFANEANATGPAIFGPIGPAVAAVEGPLSGLMARIGEIRTAAAKPFAFTADTEPVVSALNGVKGLVDSIRADTGNLLASLNPSTPTLGFGGSISPNTFGPAPSGSVSTVVNNNTTVQALGANADVARELDYRTARAAARAR